MTPIEEAIRKILPIEKWKRDVAEANLKNKPYIDRIDAMNVMQLACSKDLESFIPALVEMVDRAHAEAIRAASNHLRTRTMMRPANSEFVNLYAVADEIDRITPALARLEQQKREEKLVLKEHDYICTDCLASETRDFVRCKRGKELSSALAATCAAIEAEKRKVESGLR